jgi:hypothetical protein
MLGFDTATSSSQRGRSSRALRAIAIVSCLALVTPAFSAMQRDSLVIPRLLRVYEGAAGEEFYSISSVAVERRSGALWIRHGGDDVPLRIDRPSGRIFPVGAVGSGPGEYQRVSAVRAGRAGEMLIYDSNLYRVTRLSASGVYLESWRILISQSLSSVSLLSDDQGQLYALLQLKRQFADPEAIGWGGVPLRVHQSGKVDTLSVPQSPLRNQHSWAALNQTGNGIGGVGVQAPRWIRAVDSQGRALTVWTDSAVVWVGAGPTMKRLEFPRISDTLSKSRREYAERMVASFEAQAKREGLTFLNARPIVRRERQQISGLLPTVDGGVWVIRDRDCSQVPSWRDPGTGARAEPKRDVCSVAERFSASGARLSSVAVGAPIAVRGDTVWMSLPYPMKTRADSAMLDFRRIAEFVIPSR